MTNAPPLVNGMYITQDEDGVYAQPYDFGIPSGPRRRRKFDVRLDGVLRLPLLAHNPLPRRQYMHKMRIQYAPPEVEKGWYEEMVQCPPRELLLQGETYEPMDALDQYIDFWYLLVHVVCALHHYVPLLWDELNNGQVTWAQYLVVADPLCEGLAHVSEMLHRIYTAYTGLGQFPQYREDHDGYGAIKVPSDRTTPLPATFKNWMLLQLAMGRATDPVPIETRERMIAIVAGNAYLYCRTPLEKVQHYVQGLPRMCEAVLRAERKFIVAAQEFRNDDDGPWSRNMAILGFLGSVLPMVKRTVCPLFVVNQQLDLLTDVRNYRAEAA